MDAMEIERQSTPIMSPSESSMCLGSHSPWDLSNELSNSKVIQRSGNEGNVKFFDMEYISGMIAIMEHPASFTVYQHVSIQSLLGSVSVLGYELCPQNRPIEVFSSEKTGLIEVKTETSYCIWKKKCVQEELRQQLISLTGNNDYTNNILSNFGKTSAAVFVKRIPLPPMLKFLEIYFPNALDFELNEKKPFAGYTKCVHLDDLKHKPVQFDDSVENLISKISMSIRSSKLKETDAPRVIVCGPKNIGKSSLLRYIINKMLSEHNVVYYLDTDPGQAEFTPPGGVSLTKVTKPIIGPSFCHIRSPISMIFTGSSSPTSLEMYSRSVTKLMKQYQENFWFEPLFVNTMGWMEGLGLEFLRNLITIVKPTILVEIQAEGGVPALNLKNEVLDKCECISIISSFDLQTHFSAKEKREMTLLSYFGNCQNPFKPVVPLNEIQPYRVSWDKIPLYIFNSKLQSFRMVEAMSHSIVALCAVPETAILKNTTPEYPVTLEDEPDNECLGFGLVRAIDETSHLLYIITPLKSDALKKVNAIIKGNIMIPDVVIKTQEIYGEDLPYTYKRMKNSEETNECSMNDECLMTICGKNSVPKIKPSGLRLYTPVVRRSNRKFLCNGRKKK